MRSLRSSSPQPDLGHPATKSLGRASGQTTYDPFNHRSSIASSCGPSTGLAM
jgi:hypothetical protein